MRGLLSPGGSMFPIHVPSTGRQEVPSLHFWPLFLNPTWNSVDWTGKNAAAKLLQSCPTLCNPRDGSPPGSPVPGILQARTLERAAISFSNAWKWKVEVKSLSRVWLLVTPWTAAHQAPPSMGFARQEYWSGLPLPSPLERILDCKSENWAPVTGLPFLASTVHGQDLGFVDLPLLMVKWPWG